MSFVDQILRYESVSIVGMAKNAGKTEALNHVLRGVCRRGCAHDVAVTSIGLDGERSDRVTGTGKPEIEICEGMIFATSESHYRQKLLVAEILDIGKRETPLGRLATARALTTGKVLLSGPSDTDSLRELIAGFKRRGVRTTIVDGALSRLSHGSPAVTDAMVLVTGAAVSANIPRLVRETKYVCDRIRLEAVDAATRGKLTGIENGVWAVDGRGGVHDLGVRSVLARAAEEEDMFRYGDTIYAAGAVSDRLLEEMRMQKRDMTLIIRDFTRIFASMGNYYAFLSGGGTIKVLQKSELIAVCVNPVSPEGYRLDPDALAAAVEQSLDIPVYDVKRM